MREIKFRGRIINTVEWVEGNLLILEDSVSIRLKKRHPEDGYVTYEVAPETVGQFTGLTDKNGRDIYEGDIVKITTKIDYYESSSNHEIGWASSGKFHPMGTLFDNLQDAFWGLNGSNRAALIGNIHDNPELLK